MKILRLTIEIEGEDIADDTAQALLNDLEELAASKGFDLFDAEWERDD